MTDVLDTLDATLSHTRGETEPPLIEQTIGDNLDATVARFGDREAQCRLQPQPEEDLHSSGSEPSILRTPRLPTGHSAGIVGVSRPHTAMRSFPKDIVLDRGADH